MFSKYPSQKFYLCCNKLMVIFAALKYIRNSLASYLFSEQMKDAFQKGVDIYIQRLFFSVVEARKCIIPDHIGCICFAWKSWLEGQSEIRMSQHEIQLWQLWMKGEVRGLSGADSSTEIGGDFHGAHSKGSTEYHCSWLGGMAEHREWAKSLAIITKYIKWCLCLLPTKVIQRS